MQRSGSPNALSRATQSVGNLSCRHRAFSDPQSIVRRARSRHAFVLLTMVLVVGLGARQELPVLAAGDEPQPWPGGRLTYFDASGSREAVDAAARRWNRSGARVQLTRADRARRDVVFVADRKRLPSLRPRCLGLASSIGLPSTAASPCCSTPRSPAGRPR